MQHAVSVKTCLFVTLIHDDFKSQLKVEEMPSWVRFSPISDMFEIANIEPYWFTLFLIVQVG